MLATRRAILKFSTGLAAAAVAGRWAGPAFAGSGEPLQRIIADIADTAIANMASPGIQIALWKDGKSVCEVARGMANLETRTAVTADSIFRIGSLTKQYAGLMIAMLASQGKLSLDDPAHRHLTFLQGQPTFTIAELLHHTAGVHDADNGPQLADVVTQVQMAQVITTQSQVFDFPPGTAWLYSNANYFLLGAIIEQVTGSSLADAAQRLMFDPLELKHTHFDDAAQIVPGRASGYGFTEEAAPAWRNAPFVDVAQIGAAGAIRANANDLCRWHAALLDERKISREVREMMLAPGRLRDGRLASAHRFNAEDSVMGKTEYGFGLLLDRTTRDGSLIIQHNGFIDGFSANLATHVPTRLSFACLCNADPNPNLPFRDLRRALFAAVLLPPGTK